MHYIDPPYESAAADWLYKPMKAKELIKTLKRIKGKFLLSFEDTTSTRRTFQNAGFRVERIKTSYSIQPLKSVNKSELIVMNY
jgi:YesN/AraC family two-component response regulator